MNKRQESILAAQLFVAGLLLSASGAAFAQRPQDNWYQDAVWVKTNAVSEGGLVEPFGVAIGRDRRIYVGDQGSQRIQVYLPDGTFSFGIINGFGGGETFGQPRGMIFDRNGNLYVADYTNNCVFVFTADGAFVRKIGGVAGSGDGQLNGVIDVGVALGSQIYILERGNSRVSVFDSNGGFLRKWGGPGLLDGQFDFPMSIAVAGDDWIYVCQRKVVGINWQAWQADPAITKAFDGNGRFRKSYKDLMHIGDDPGATVQFQHAGSSVRITPGGDPSVLRSFFSGGQAVGTWGSDWYPPVVAILSRELELAVDCHLFSAGVNWSQVPGDDYTFPCHAFGPDGTFVVCRRGARMLYVWKQTWRDLLPPNPNAIPIPAVWRTVQRSSSPLVDIDYEVTDADDATVQTGVLVFKDGVQAIGNCVRNLTLMEGTSTNLGPAIAANQLHRITWNAGADLSTNLVNYRVAVLAKDSQTNLLDIHFLRLPADHGMPALTISRCPLMTNDFMQVWWWLLATGDSGIGISSNSIVGVGGAYDAQSLCDGGLTTPNGRSYIYGKMNIREATAAEVQWARQGNMPSGSSPNQWIPARQVSGRPRAVNEYGFDTGSWDTNTCKWVVRLP